MKHNIFIDIDGTLCDFSGVIPDTAKKGIKAVRENGHKVFICTGRAKSEVYKEVIDIGFDGMVCSAGAYIECENQMIFHQSIEEKRMNDLITYLQESNAVFILETNESVFIQKKFGPLLVEFFKKTGMADNKASKEYLNILAMVDDISTVNQVNKVIFFHSEKSIEQMQTDLSENFLILPNSIGPFAGNSGEISNKNINKATGIEKVLSYYGKNKESVIAFGDGANDVEMLEFAQIGIAMGNAWDKLKEFADDVTDSVLENGIYNSLIKYKLI